ncbi:MAG: YcgN family cysteine cluster protein [Rhodospirillaceae bacterium]|nr:YcgN family cysteine cluster protein [Rhodospirillaceae bacterium]
MTEAAFWETKTLTEMTRDEWESLCDGCGKCCLHKLQDEDSGELAFTNVACILLDLKTARCTDYARRRIRVPDCVRLTAAGAQTFSWLPRTCAYRLLAEGKTLPAWHHLVCGDPHAVHRAGVSVRGRCVREDQVIDFEDYLVAWEDL